MLYDLSNPLHREGFKTRCNALFKKQCIVELTEKRPRTLAQNSYLHVALGYFGIQVGHTVNEVKDWYYKETCNPDLFVRKVTDAVTGNARIKLRSSSDLTTEEMTLSINRFRDWAAQVAGVYIPSPEDHRLIQMMEIETNRNKRYL